MAMNNTKQHLILDGVSNTWVPRSLICNCVLTFVNVTVNLKKNYYDKVIKEKEINSNIESLHVLP